MINYLSLVKFYHKKHKSINNHLGHEVEFSLNTKNNLCIGSVPTRRSLAKFDMNTVLHKSLFHIVKMDELKTCSYVTVTK